MKFKKILHRTLSLNEMAQSHLTSEVITALKEGEIAKAAEEYKKQGGPPSGVRNTVRKAMEVHTNIPVETWKEFANLVSPTKTKPASTTINKNLSPTQKEDWFNDNTNLEKKRGKGEIRVEHKGKILSLPNFLKTGIEEFFTLGITTEVPKEDEIRINASFENKQDLILNNGGSIELIDGSNKTNKTFSSGSRFELKDLLFKNLEGHYIFQIARISTFDQAIKLVDQHYGDHIKLQLSGEEETKLFSTEKVKKIITSKNDTPKRQDFREAFKYFLDMDQTKEILLSKVVNFLEGGGIGLEFFNNITSFLNSNKQEVVSIPENLYIMATGGLKNGEEIIQNFNTLDDRIKQITHENIYFSVETGRIAFEHIEAKFSFNESKEYNIAKEIINISEFALNEDTSTNTVNVARLSPSREERILFEFKIPIILETEIRVK